MATELELMLKGYTKEEKQEVLDKAERIENLMKAMVKLEESYDDEGNKPKGEKGCY